MNSMPDPTLTDPPTVLTARADEQLAHAYEQIKSADEQLARVNAQFFKLEHDAERRRRSRDRPALRGLVGLLLAACIGAAALLSHSSYGDTAKLMIAGWMPQRALASSQPQQAAVLPGQPDAPAVQVAAADATPSASASPAQAAPEAVVPTAATLSPEVTDLLQTMARDVAAMQQGIEQLKTNLAQMGRDNAKAAEELKANQERMARLIAAASEPNARPRTSAISPTSASPPRTATAPAHKPVTALPSQQARARPQAPVQLQPDDQ
jgi:hypothetical protein